MKYLKLFLVFFLVNIFSVSFSQMHGGSGGHFNPDTLEVITVSGFAMVDTSSLHKMYFLDENNDGVEDYFLNFGPYWYEPDSSNAVRPENGEYVTIEGGIVDSSMMNVPAIVVYEINGEFWRDPFTTFWNNMGQHGFNCGGHSTDSCHTVGFGWQHDPPQTVSLSGFTLVDTTFMMEHFYLDEDNDGIPEYFLNFGPPWYEPPSGASRPANGSQIDIVGGLIENGNFSMVVVYEINGLLWRDSTFFGGHMGGGWINKNMAQSVLFNTPFDEKDRIEMNPGWHTGGGGHQGGMRDSLFCQMFEIIPGEIFEQTDENAFAAYEVDFFFPSMMGGGMNNMMGCGGYMNFNSSANIQFHYEDSQILLRNISESSVVVKYWDNSTYNWVTILNAVINTSENTITFSQTKVANYFILTGDSPTSLENSVSLVPDEFVLKQNYPNPFNPTTTIEFSVPVESNVEITLYNILGVKIAQLVNSNYEAGNYSIKFDGQNLSSGVYFYQLKTDNFSIVRKMQLVK